MRTIALYMHCERWITVRLRRNYKMIGSRKVRNPGILKELWRSRGSNHMRALIAGDRNSALKRHLGS